MPARLPTFGATISQVMRQGVMSSQVGTLEDSATGSNAAGAVIQWNPPFWGYANRVPAVRIATRAVAEAGLTPQNDQNEFAGFVGVFIPV
jgi:hypothetical protein